VYLERFTDEKGDLFIKFPLINNLLNQRGWRATTEANERYARTAIGKPLSLMLDKKDSLFYDYHPFSRDIPIDDRARQVEFARKYEYGHVVDVTKNSGSYKSASGEIPWFGIGKVTDPTVKEEWKKPETKLIPPAFSPGIAQLDGPDDAITQYEILHVASVPSGAFGPKFIAIGKCQGDLNTCTPQLRAASYKERLGICPKDAFSSLLLKSGSSDNTMSMSSNANSTPGPMSFGQAQVSDPSGNTLATQNVQPKQKPTIYYKKLRFSGQSTEPKPNGEQTEQGGEGGGDTGNTANMQTDENADRAFRSSKYFQEMQNMKKQLEQRTQQWDYKEKRYQLEKIIKPSLFTERRGNSERFNQKAWEAEIEKAIKENIPIEWLQMYYANKEQLSQVPELQVKRASSPEWSNPLGSLQSASSLEADEEKIRAEKALRLNGGY